MSEKPTKLYTSRTHFLGFFGWLGGAVYVAHQPGMNGWDGFIWLYYVGRFIAQHFTALS